MMAKLDYDMGRRPLRNRLVWVPPLLAGAAAATAAELAAGLLLYSALGFLRALTVVLVVELGAFALGLWSATALEGVQDTQWVRRRWFFALTTFTGAAGFAVAWRVLENETMGGLTQGLGLALLGGLPMFSIAALLGAMERVGTSAHGAVPGKVGASAALGAAAGFLVTGFFFVPVLEPSSTLLVCVIGLSAGALLYGWVADGAETGTVLESCWTPTGEVRIEDRVGGALGRSVRVLLESDRLRGAEDGVGRGLRRWEGAVLAGVKTGPEAPASIMLFGLGAGTLARGLVERLPDVRIVGIEPNQDSWRLARAHFPVGHRYDDDPWKGIEAYTGLHLEEAIRLLGSKGHGSPGFDLAVIDLTALGPLTPLPPIHPRALSSFGTILAPGAPLVLGPFALTDEQRPGLDSWVAVENGFSWTRLYDRDGGVLCLSSALAPAAWSLPDVAAHWGPESQDSRPAESEEASRSPVELLNAKGSPLGLGDAP